MDELDDEAMHEGVAVDLIFRGDGPTFGDLVVMCGYENPSFPPSGRFDFAAFENLQFTQVDDYFGVQSLSDVGDDVAIWLYPLADGEVVHHHPGPFEGLRLTYCPLRNPPSRGEHFLTVVSRLASELPVDLFYQTRKLQLPVPDAVEQLRRDIAAIEAHWNQAGIPPGSSAALAIDF